jgi:hypothetical protein
VRVRDEIGRVEGDGDRFSGGSAPVEPEDKISGRSLGGGAESSLAEPKQTRS